MRTFQHEVVGYCVNMLGDKTHGDEVAQNVFLAAYTAMGRFRGDASVRTWLFAIARRQCWKAMKQARRQASLRPPEPQAMQASPEHDLLELEEEARWQRRQDRLSHGLQRLKKRDRDVLMMYYYLNVARTKSQSLLEPHDIRLRGHQASARASRSSFL